MNIPRSGVTVGLARDQNFENKMIITRLSCEKCAKKCTRKPPFVATLLTNVAETNLINSKSGVLRLASEPFLKRCQSHGSVDHVVMLYYA